VAGGPGAVRFANTDEGVARLVAAWSSEPTTLVVAEATGGYEFRLVRALHAASLAVAVVNPRQVRDFARASGRLAKTDAIDATQIARFGEVMKPRPLPLLAPGEQTLSALVTRRRQLVDMLVAEKNRLELAEAAIRHWIDETMSALKTQLAAVDAAIALTIDQSAAFRHCRDILTSVPGVGQLTAP
jgi:transposase